MKTILPDGRIFETKLFLTIDFDDSEPVYKYQFTTDDRIVKSSARHTWAVWDKTHKLCAMIEMSMIDKEKHELLVQGRIDAL